MTDTFFKGYWLVTNRCNLACGYCVLENAPDQLQRELDLAGKRDLVTHLYQRLGFRRITLSGGEVLLMGKRPPTDFVHLLRHLKTFRSTDPRVNLEVEVYTNGTLLDDAVADEMAGVVDLVAVTIDSSSDDVLTQLGRNRGRDRGYFQRAVEVCARLSSRGIGVKLHSVVGAVNHASLPDDVTPILDAIERRGGSVSTWKFYQYMSYDAPAKDRAHAITATAYAAARDRISGALAGRGIPLHFKDTDEMAASMFNILSYGNAQYQRPGDTWSTTRRTEALQSYASMADLFARHDLDESTFRRFHEARAMSVAFTVDLDWAGEAAISELLDFLRDRAIPTTVFTTHRSARVEAAFDELEVGVHPHFGAGSSHGATVEEVVHNVLALPHNVPGFRCHRFATSNEIVGALHAAGLQFGSNVCTDLDPLPPFRDRFGLWQFPVFLEDGGYLYRRRPLTFDDGDVAGALAGPGLHVLLLHPMHFALNTPDFAFMRSHKDVLSPSEWQAQSRGQLDARRHRGLGIRDFLVALTDYIACAAIPITTLGRVYATLTGSSTA